MTASVSRPGTARSLDIVGVLAVVVGLVLGFVPGIANAAHDVPGIGAGEFEIDGNTAGAHDWETLGGMQTSDGTGNTDISFFKASLTELSYPGWTFVPGANAPKADLHQLFVNSQLSDAGSFIWLGATRVADNGNVQVTVEFNQEDLTLAGMTGDYREKDDFFIRFNFPGDSGADVDAYLAQWTGSAWGPETELTQNVNFRAATGTLGSDSREFVELEIDLAGLFGAGGSFDCGSFGAVSFRTEASGGNNDNNQPTLKDIAGPFSIDLDTCGEVTVEKVDAEGKTLEGVGFTVYAGNSTAVSDEVATCTTDATGGCSFGQLQPGAYTIDETTVPPGYTKAAGLPAEFTVGANAPLTLGPYTDPRIDYEIGVQPNGRNAVGNTHDFLVTLTDAAGTGLAGQTVDLSWSGVGAITAVNGGAAANSCTTRDDDAGTTDADETGTCLVTVRSDDAGDGDLTASWDTPYQNAVTPNSPVSATNGEPVATISDAANKVWVGYVASVEESATNLVSNGDTAGQHVFTATVKEDDGSGTLTAAAGVQVDVTWTGAPEDATISPDALRCTTNASGQCTFTVDSPTAGAGTITIVGLDGTILGLDDTTDTDDENLVDGSPTAESGKALTATKTWREYRALIDGDATNPVGEAHTFNVQVQYREDDGANSWTDARVEGMTVAWDSPAGVGSVDAASTCDDGTDADGHCTIVVDTEPDEAGSRTVTLRSVTGDLLPGDVPNDTTLTYAFADTQYDADADEFRAATKTWIEFGANIVSDGHNLVSTTDQPVLGVHEFTVTVWRKPAPGASETAVPAGTKVTTSIDWVSGFPEPAGLVHDNDCLSDGTSNVVLPDGGVASQCTITLNSTVPGVATVTPSGLVGYDYGDGTGSQTVTFGASNTDSAVKTWYRYRAWIDADSTNLAGSPEGDHDFAVTVEQDSGAGWGPVPNDTTVTVTSPDATNDGSLDDTSCATTTTAGVSSCLVGVSSLDPGSRTVAVSQVEALDVDGDPWVDVSNGEHLDVADATQRTAATKTWVDHSATISADATNLTGQDHVFTVTAFVDSGDGAVAAPAGTTLAVDVDEDFLVGDTCADGTGNQTNPLTEAAAADNECFVTVTSDAVDSVTVTVTSATPVSGTVDGDPSDDITDVAATKTWVEAGVTISPDEVNIVGEPHTFLVDVHVRTPDGLVDVDELDGATVGISVAGTTGVVDASSCDDSDGSALGDGTVDGRCEVVVSSAGPGTLTVTATTINFALEGDDFVVDLTGNEGVASEQTLDDRRSTKTWRAYRASIAEDGLNLVRDAHSFTVTVQQTDVADPREADWQPAPDGTTAAVAATSPGSITSTDCDSPDGTTGGTCTVTVNSSVAGTSTVTVSAISVAHPESGAVTTVDVVDDRAVKTWVAFRGVLSADSVNVTGDDHVFGVLVEYTTNGIDWTPVFDRSSVTFTDDGTGSVTGDTCDSTRLEVGDELDARVCTITVDSDTSGSLDVTLTGVVTTITSGDLAEEFDVTFPSGADDVLSGIPDGFALADYSATKTWAAYTLALDPAAAVNLLNGRDDDGERYHTITATLASDDATNALVGGQPIEVAISGDTGVIDSVEAGDVAADGLSATCVTAADGTCDIVIFSATPGQATLSGSYLASVGDSAPVVVASNDAVKTWTTFRVTVTPATAVNLVGNPHVFTVTVEQANATGGCDTDWCPVGSATPSIDVTGDGVTVDAADCDAGTDADGTCTVTVTSTTVQAVTLTATHTESYGDYATEVQGTSTIGFSDAGGKSWIDHDIDVDPSEAENLVGTDHVFTVTVTTTFPTAAGTTTEGVVGAVPSISVTGLGSITANTCTAGTVDDDPTTDVDEAGTCLVTIRSSVPGASTLTATYGGTAADDDEVRHHTDSGRKLWVDYALVIDPELANNTVGDPHTFTATLTVDTGNGPVAAVGEALQFTVDGVGGVTGGDVDDALACVTDDAGECDIIINSTEAGTTDVAVSHGAVVGETSRTYGPVQGTKNWVDIDLVKTAVVGGGFGDGDLVADPDTGLPTLFFTSTDRAPKTAVFEYTITNTGPVALQDVVLTDDRLGTVVALADGVTLEPGASTTVRARERFTYDDAAGGLESIIVNVGVVTANDGEGNDVSDTDDAAITLIAQQSSILIDLQKDVVPGAGDVEADDGMPTVTWSQDELEANESKVVRYAFTVTNVGPAPIVDVELTDPMISDQPIIAAADGVTLQPGASTTVEVDHVLTADEAFPDGPTAGEVPNVATVRGANETRDAFDQDSDEAIVFVQVVFSETVRPQKEPPLPATGLQDGGLLPLSVLLISVGAAILWLDRRRDAVR